MLTIYVLEQKPLQPSDVVEQADRRRSVNVTPFLPVTVTAFFPGGEICNGDQTF